MSSTALAVPRAAAPPIDPDTIRAIALHGARDDREASFPFESLQLLREAGALALTVPVALGGAGGGIRLAVEAVRQVGSGCPATALILAMQLAKQAAIARSPAWPAVLRERLGRLAVTEGALINAARVEPELGSPTRGGLPGTIARRTGTGWALTGHKRYVTGLPGLRFIEVLARTDEDEPRVGNFLVTAGTPGLEEREAWNHLGLRASGSHDLILTDVAVPESHAIGLAPAAAWVGNDPIQSAWNALLVPAVYTGVALAAREWILDFLRHRKPSGLAQPLAALPTVQQAVGALEAQLIASRRLSASLVADIEAGNVPPASETGAVKALLSNHAIRAVEIAVSLAGNHALDRANPLERHWRDVQCARVHVPTEDAAHQNAGRAALAEGAAA
ncbi:acyl-CoA dehydrogenase family protein [Roseococcus sp. YIM B11640]|uniref:acyl-CoA dehydrogenase family protein n=1 Tax=Roseococcus sp. YIM B11640 TaxID=3133973 RepID=UPI003C7EBEFB